MEHIKTTLLKLLMAAKDWAGVGRSHPRLALVLGAALVLLVASTVSAQAETLPSGAPSGAAEPMGPIRTHSGDGDGGDEDSFSIACGACHVQHEASGSQLLRVAEGAAVCATCHDADDMHGDPATQQGVLSTAGDCFTCHPHSSGFMPVSGAVSLTLTKEAVGYDDLDADGTLSPGDRVHYRIDYGNPGPEDVTGAVLGDKPDTAYVAGVESITGGGTFEGTDIQWTIGALAAEASGFATYDVVLQAAAAFDGVVTMTSDGATTTETSATTDSTTTTTAPTSTPAARVVEVVNTAVLTADDRDPVSVSATVSMVIGDPIATTPSSTPTSLAPTDPETSTTAAPTTSTTIPPGSFVVNRAVLTGDDRAPVSTSAVLSVVVPGLTVESTTTSTTEVPTAVADPTALILSEQVEGYDDLDADGNLSPGDRVHFRIDYGNPGPADTTGVLLREEPDKDHVVSIEAISDNGDFDLTAIQWNIGILAAGASGFVTYDAVLRDAAAFGGAPVTTTTTVPATTDTATTTTTTDISTTTSTTADTSTTTDTSAATPTTDSTMTTATTDSTVTSESTTTTTSVPMVAGVALFALAGAPTRRLFRRRRYNDPDTRSAGRGKSPGGDS